MSITISSLRNNLFYELYDIINTNVSDPLSRGKQWIFSSPNIIFAPNFIGFPIISIHSIEIKKEFSLLKDDSPVYYANFIVTAMATSEKVLDELCNSIDNALIPSNSSQLLYIDYDEKKGVFHYNDQNVYYRDMIYRVKLIGIYNV